MGADALIETRRSSASAPRSDAQWSTSRTNGLPRDCQRKTVTADRNLELEAGFKLE